MLLPNGTVLVAGGQGTSDTLDSAELLDPATGTARPGTITPPPPTATAEPDRWWAWLPALIR